MADLPQSYDPRRFQSAVGYYARYRLGYPESLIAKVIELVGLKHGDAVLDLGCGPGTLAIPFARAGMMVTGVDPEPEMLAACEAGAQAAGVAVALKHGSSFDMPDGIGPFRLITMGRSFHWMDREGTLAKLDALVTRDGAVAHFDDEHPHTVENAWRRALTDLGDKYGRADAPHILDRRSAEYRTHESYFLNSPFCRIERYGVVVQREITADDVVGLAYSLSYTTPQRLGDRKDKFERELRAALAEISPEGRFTEIADLGAMIGHWAP
jgi:SAM-dependent methyltransferase